MLAPRPTPKLENHPLSAVRDCLCNKSQLPSIYGGRLHHPHYISLLVGFIVNNFQLLHMFNYEITPNVRRLLRARGKEGLSTEQAVRENTL